MRAHGGGLAAPISFTSPCDSGRMRWLRPAPELRSKAVCGWNLQVTALETAAPGAVEAVQLIDDGQAPSHAADCRH